MCGRRRASEAVTLSGAPGGWDTKPPHPNIHQGRKVEVLVAPWKSELCETGLWPSGSSVHWASPGRSPGGGFRLPVRSSLVEISFSRRSSRPEDELGLPALQADSLPSRNTHKTITPNIHPGGRQCACKDSPSRN